MLRSTEWGNTFPTELFGLILDGPWVSWISTEYHGAASGSFGDAIAIGRVHSMTVPDSNGVFFSLSVGTYPI